MEVDYIIVGQGISGTFLSWYLEKEGKSFMVLDRQDSTAPSKMAAGVINPVTGRRLVTVWMVEDILPFAWEAYQGLGRELGIEAISARTIIDFFPNPFMREGFLQKIETGDHYVHAFPEQNQFNQFFNYEFGCGEIRPAYTAHLETLLPAWREHLELTGRLRTEDFILGELLLEKESIRYRDIDAKKIIFCDGTTSFENPFFKALPFAPNKGEALLVEIPGLPSHHIYKKGLMMVPMTTPDLFWVGASYIWDFENPDPTPAFLESTVAALHSWLKIPFRVVQHLSGLRPATLERRPFVGLHPVESAVGILNGMGTKGCSLAPFFAKQLVDHLIYGMEITPQASLGRFHKILSRQ